MPTRVLVGPFGDTPAAAVTPPSARDAAPPTPSAPSGAPRSRRLPGLLLIVASLAVAASALWIWRPAWFKPKVWLETVSKYDPTANSPTTAEAEPAGATQGRAEAEAAAPRTPPAAITAARTGAASRSAAGPEVPSPSEPQTPETVVQISGSASSPVADEPAAVAAVPAAAANEVAGVIAPASPAVVDAPPGAVRNGRPAAPSRVYGEGDAGVTPPELVGSERRRLGGLIGAIDPGTEVTIEFIVNELGAVESAKAKTPPRTLGESLLLATGLHAVKSWRFQPAQKDGQPVSYQKSISFGAY